MAERVYEVIVIGAGAAGMMCAIETGKRGRDTIILEQGRKAGAKIIISGGGRCNFTNMFADPRENYLSQNKHFCLSAMKRYTQWDFIGMVERHGIAYHEKKLGQLFCDGTSREIVDMLLSELEAADVPVRYECAVTGIAQQADKTFVVKVGGGEFHSQHVVLACGGLSIPKIASDLAFRTANDLELHVVAPQAALVPFTWNSGDKTQFEVLSGISLDCEVSCGDGSFRENLLFTHRGLSGPAILQISSFWQEGETVMINLLPELDAFEWLTEQRETNGQSLISSALATLFPKRVVEQFTGYWFTDKQLAQASTADLQALADQLNSWQFRPGGTEGYRTAEVTLGGIDTDELSSKTMECKRHPGLFVVGEAVDVTGWLGGYNFQWAWASGWCAGQVV